jgi:hypothetical protein
VEIYDSLLRYRDSPLLALNHKGHFAKGNAGSDVPVAGRGAAFGDLNNDGRTDVITTALGEHPQLFLNRGSNLHWLTITLHGKRSNRDVWRTRSSQWPGSLRHRHWQLSLRMTNACTLALVRL